MAGYFIYSLDGAAFHRLTTSPTDEDALALARAIHERVLDSESFPEELDALAGVIKARLTLADWYADLSDLDKQFWNDVIWQLTEEAGEQIGIGFECSDYESIYWDCAEEAAAHGADMLDERYFGYRGYRYSGPVTDDCTINRMYGILDPAEVHQLHEQLRAVESYFAGLPDDGAGGVREQFFEGLLPPVRDADERGRCLFIQTDT